MPEVVQPIPAGFHAVTPHLIVKGAAEAIEFYRTALGAEEIFRNTIGDSGVILHARLRIGDSFLMLNDEFPEHGVLGPDAERPSPVTIHVYTEDVDALYQRATARGMTVVMPLADMFWGDRYAILQDPFGHRWSLAMCVEELTPDEMNARGAAAFGAEV